jgi:tetratricopeptide (TPR) repeat protein
MPARCLPLTLVAPGGRVGRNLATQRRIGTRVRAVVAALCLLTAMAPSVALAIDPAKVAATIATAAGNAYANGEFQRAAELYLNAYRSDAKPEYLFGGARSQHVAGQYDMAVDTYRKFLALNPPDPARVEKAKAYIAEIDSSRAASQVLDADKADRAGDHHMAAALYYDAWQRAQRPEYLFKAAIAAQTGDEKPNAIHWLQEYLAKAPATAADRRQAELRLETLQAPPKVSKPEPKPEPVKEAVKPLQPERTPAQLEIKPEVKPVAPELKTPIVSQPRVSEPKWAAWTTLGTGVALLGAGVGLSLAQLGPLADYNASLAKDADGQIRGTDLQTSTAKAQSINTKIGVGIGLAVVGAGATAVGTWLLLREGPKTTANAGAPSVSAWFLPNGAGLAGRF